MSETDNIKNIIQELNRVKSNVVANAQGFQKESAELASKTEDKTEATKLAELASSLKAITSAKIPDLIYKGGPGPTFANTIKITSPLGSKSPHNTPVPVTFEVDGPHHNAGKEYDFLIIITDAGGTEVLKDAHRTKVKNVALPTQLDIPIFVDGEYTITIQTFDTSSGTAVPLASQVQEKFKIINKIHPRGSHKVMIRSPTKASSPYSVPATIEFEVAGPHHDAGKTYEYEIKVSDGTRDIINQTHSSNHKKVPVPDKMDLPDFQDGVYQITITTFDKTAGLLASASETFAIKTKSLPPSLHKVTIKSPINAKSPYKSPVIVEFKVEGPHHASHKDYTYELYITDQRTKATFADKLTLKDTDVIHPKHIPLADGSYDIEIRTFQAGTNIPLAPVAKDSFIVSSGPSPIMKEEIRIDSPIAARSPYQTGKDIPIGFTVSGPHHSVKKEFAYILLVLDKTGRRVFNDRGLSTSVNVIHSIPLILPDGEYRLQVTTADPVTKKVLASKEEMFVIGASGPTNIIRNIYINNNIVNAAGITLINPLPFSIPFKIKFELTDPRFITYFTHHPITIKIRITEDGTGRIIYDHQNLFMHIEYTTPDHVPLQKEGKYNIYIELIDNSKTIYKRVVPLTVKKENKPAAKRNDPVLSVHVDGKESLLSLARNSKDKEHTILIRNVGGGRMGWKMSYPPWLDIVHSSIKLKDGIPTSVLEGGKSVDIKFRYNKSYDTVPQLVAMMRTMSINDVVQINATNNGHLGGDAGHYTLSLHYR